MTLWVGRGSLTGRVEGERRLCAAVLLGGVAGARVLDGGEQADPLILRVVDRCQTP